MLTPDQVEGLSELVQSLCLLALLGGVMGAIGYSIVARALSALWDHFADARYKAYQKAANRG